MNPPANPESSRYPTPPGVATATTTESYKARLTDEYKILQDKIDKIGAFRFTIKGWSVTVLVAASVAAANSNTGAGVAAISLGLALVVIAFFWFEMEQVSLSNRFGNRAKRIEDAFARFDSGRWNFDATVFPVPNIATELARLAFRQRKDAKVTGRESLRSRTRPVRGRTASTLGLWKQAHPMFYLVLFCYAFAPLFAYWMRSPTHPLEVKITDSPVKAMVSPGPGPPVHLHSSEDNPAHSDLPGTGKATIPLMSSEVPSPAAKQTASSGTSTKARPEQDSRKSSIKHQ